MCSRLHAGETMGFSIHYAQKSSSSRIYEHVQEQAFFLDTEAFVVAVSAMYQMG
jgi:hypothetical protein